MSAETTAPQAEADPHPFFTQLSELLSRIKIAGGVTVFFFAFFFIFEPKPFTFAGMTLIYPYPGLFTSFSSEFFDMMRAQLLPPQMILINLNSFDAFTASVYTAAVLALIPSMPVWVYELGGFVGPALTPKEKKTIQYLLMPASLLFLAGVVFAYWVVLPILFRFLYYFILAFNALPTISIMSFVTMVLAYMIAMGLAFELPIVIVGLTYVGLVSYSTWFHYWRHAVVGAFFIALVISPPGATGGIIEISIGLLLSALYLIGAAVARFIELRRKSSIYPLTSE
ncbi:MAG: preprotein translocase subunit TatC [Nitrososphaerota archaeon]|jgi:sec-independent protein translocase protein TatC|nr:preprotein translocase subunit TatC [Nitrososphaerota archaeon]